jgi:hypothetical protein
MNHLNKLLKEIEPLKEKGIYIDNKIIKISSNLINNSSLKFKSSINKNFNFENSSQRSFQKRKTSRSNRKIH